MKIVNLIALIAGTIAFNVIFWEEKIALNFALFSLFSIIINYLNNPKVFLKRTVQVTTAGNLMASFFLLYHHSVVAHVAAIVSWVIMIGFYQQDELRTVHRALLSSIINFFKLPPIFSKVNFTNTKFSHTKFERRARTIFLPVLGLIIFLVIFYAANSVFSKIVDRILDNIDWFFTIIFLEISGQRVAFFILGFMVSSWFIYKAIYGFFTKNEKSKTVDLFRVRRKRKNIHSAQIHQGLQTGLKTENKSGLLLMGMVSLLLVFINLLDIVFVWFGYGFDPNTDFSADVHTGVNLLIFSIFLSIFIMVYYFRRNQNFYSKNKRIKQVAQFWILQNFILIISVIFRNAHYIQHHGLTHKRIGVFIFLTVVFIGLISLYVKITKTKSFFFLSKFNSWSLYGILIFMACFNWDMIIFNHNFSNRFEKEIDITYLIDLSDEVILHLNKNKDILEEHHQINLNQTLSRNGYSTFAYRMRIIRLDHVNDKTTLFSWNHRKVRMDRFFVNYKSRLDEREKWLESDKERRGEL